MAEIIIQYVLIVLLIVGLGYLVYLLKDKNIKNDYFGLTYPVLNTLQSDEDTTENVKKIIRTVSEDVKYVEDNFKYEDNSIKEDQALKLVKNSFEVFRFESAIDENSIRYLIRIGASMLPPTHNDNKENDVSDVNPLE